MEINRSAPVQAAAEIHIAAPVEVVWATQAELETWPDWNPDVTSIEVLGPVAPGTEFRWKAGGVSVVSTLREVSPPGRLAWTGRTMGIRAVHTWSFHQEDGGTRVQTEESFEGWVARLLGGWLRGNLAVTLAKGLEALRIESERRHAAETVGPPGS